MPVGVDVVNSVLYELREPMEAAFEQYSPLHEALTKRGQVSSEKARYVEGGVAGGSSAQAVGEYNGTEPLDTNRTEVSYNWRIESHRLVTAISIPKKEMVYTSGKAAAVPLVKKYPELHIKGLAMDFDRFFFTGVSNGISVQTSELQGWNTLNGQKQWTRGVLGVEYGALRFEDPASQSVEFQDLARSNAYKWVNGYAESTAAADVKKVLKKEQRKASRFAMPIPGGTKGPDTIFCDDDTYGIFEERQDSQVRITTVQQGMDNGKDPATNFIMINTAKLIAAQNLILTDFTGDAAEGICMGLTMADIEWLWYQKPTLSDFQDRIANADSVIAKYEMQGLLLFKRLTTHFAVVGTARE
jgi:hypothetical protein